MSATKVLKMMGASAGGVFALYALQAKPELFQAHIAYQMSIRLV